MNRLFEIFYKHTLIILIPLFFILSMVLIIWRINMQSKFYLTAKFADSGPLYKNMSVYYKGYKIGYIEGIRISKDYQYTLVKIVFYPKCPMFYKNLVAKAKKLEEKNDYIDLIYPDESSKILLAKGEVIEGRGAFDVDSLLSDVAEADILVPLLQHFSDVLVSADATSDEIKKFFSDTRSIIKDNRENLNQTTQNLEQTTKSLKRITSKFNSSITKHDISNTTSNVYKSSDNILTATESIKDITKNIDCATRNLDKTIAKVDCTVTEANTIAANIRVITGSLCKALGKRFAGLRILFGKPMANNCTQKSGN